MIRDSSEWLGTVFDSYYLTALETVMLEGKRQYNARTQQNVTAYPGLHVRLDLARDGFPLLSARKIPVRLFVAEMLWYISGARDIAWLQQYTRVWDKFIETNGQLAAAYGQRWRRSFGRDQLRELTRQLRKDPSSRQMVVMCWHPGRDGLTNQGVIKNVPCLPSFTVNVIDGELNMGVECRSNDMILGCPHDVPGYALLAYLLAKSSGYKPGILSYHVTHAHIYESHDHAARELVKRIPSGHTRVDLDTQDTWFNSAMCDDAAGMNDAVSDITTALKSQYTPMPSVGRLTLHP